MSAVLEISNDGRGWIMTALSGIACVFGASFICVDIIVRQIPGKQNFQIRDSNTFISLSLSLSFGVMLFSALYSMLPSAKSSLIKGGHSSKNAAWILIGCFIGGIVGIQVLSRVMHRFMPHHVVPCEHTHGDEEAHKEGATSRDHESQGDTEDNETDDNQGVARTSRRSQNKTWTKTSSHLLRPQMEQRSASQQSHLVPQQATLQRQRGPEHSLERPKLPSKISSTLSKLASGSKPLCDCEGHCRGYSDLCESNCFKNVGAKGSSNVPKPTSGINRPSAVKSVTATESTPLLHEITEETLTRPHTRAGNEGNDACSPISEQLQRQRGYGSATHTDESHARLELHTTHSHRTGHSGDEDVPPDAHHHHVPTNTFASIGLQTCIAIALHKLPEGFITYATNHANPELGFAVFLALFIHNITEGFVMALPLYLALNNRLLAMVITFFLGGLSQPVGAGVAALWFKLAGNSGWTPSEAAYGAMFAITAGIMTSVALQLYAEAVDKAHSKSLCLVAAVAGMLLLGCSSALTA